MLQRTTKLVIWGVLLGILGGMCFSIVTVCQKANTQMVMKRQKDTDTDREVFNSVLRFHIRANSDSQEDQAVKLKVKEEVLSYMRPLLENSRNLSETLTIIGQNREKIKEIAVRTLEENGVSQEVKIYVTTEEFPIKTYGDMTFPSGTYKALRIDLGQAKGHNWWCMMYPPLCFVKESYGVVPESSKETLKNMLPEEEYEEIAAAQREGNVEYTSKLWECLKEIWE